MSQVATRENQIKSGLIARQKQINSLLGDKKKADKFLATAVSVANDYKLSKCNHNSIIDACVNVAQMGLDLSPVLSHAYIVPFKNSVQLIVSARGYTAMLARTGWKVKTYIVNECDDFEYKIDGFEEIVHFKKDLDSEEDTFKYAVALAESPDGTLYVEVMNAKQINKHRLVSSNQNGAKPSGVWAEWFDEMALKTVIKKLVKKLPIGEDISSALEVDDKPIEAEVVTTKQAEEPRSLNDIDVPAHNKETGEVIDELQDIEVEVS